MTDLAALGYIRSLPVEEPEQWYRDGIVGRIFVIGHTQRGNWEAGIWTLMGILPAGQYFATAELAAAWGEEADQRLANDRAALLALGDEP